MIAESVLAVAGAVLAAYLWETKIRDRVTVRRITSRADRDIGGVLDIYEQLFAGDPANYSPDEILEFLDPSDSFSAVRHVRVENIVLVARHQREVVGFLMCHFYPERRKAIISYHGINRDVAAARASAAPRLLQGLRRTLLNDTRRCDFVLFELEDEGVRRADGKRRKRNALLERFRIDASSLGLPAYRLEFPYFCPKVSLEDGSEEKRLDLICIPIHGSLPASVPRDMLLDLLAFLHMDCYGDLYPVEDPRFNPYRAYLTERVEHYQTILPEAVSRS